MVQGMAPYALRGLAGHESAGAVYESRDAAAHGREGAIGVNRPARDALVSAVERIDKASIGCDREIDRCRPYADQCRDAVGREAAQRAVHQ